MNKRGEAITILVVIGLLALGAYTLMTVSSNSPTGLQTFEPATAACGSVGASDTLTANISFNGAGSCIQITADNVVFNCLGNNIYYTNTGVGDVAAIDASNVQNITIKNCNIIMSAPTTNTAPGINFTNVNNSVIINSTVTLNGSSGGPQFLIRLSGSNGNNITNNSFNNIGTINSMNGLSLLFSSNNNRITSNNFVLNSVAASQLSGAITLGTSPTGNIIDGNSITNTGPGLNGIVLTTDASNNNITNNNITISATSTTNINGIGLNFGSGQIIIRNNNIRINTSAASHSPIGIRILSPGNNSIIENNFVQMNSSTFLVNALRFRSIGNANNFTIMNNTFVILNGTFNNAHISTDIPVSNTTIANNTFIDVNIATGIEGSSYTNMIIFNNTFINVSNGISMNGNNITADLNVINITGSGSAININAPNTTITNNQILSMLYGSGISIAGTEGLVKNNSFTAYFMGTTGITASGSNEIVFNNSLNNGTLATLGTGINMFNNTLLNSLISAAGSSNNIHDNPMTFETTTEPFIYAIQVVGGTDNNISNESVTFNTSGNDNRGIYMSGSNNRLSNINLTISGGDPTIGISVLSGSSNNIFDNIIINTNTSTALEIIDSSGNNFSNILLNNTPSWIDSQDTGSGADNNFTNITFVNTGIGQSFFPSFNINGNSNVTRTTLNMSNNRIFLNTTELPGMNQTATISWFNATTSNVEVDFDDDGTFAPCGSVCTIISFIAPNLVFSVSHFTTYQSGGAGGINLTITKTDNPDPVAPGAQLNYTITINVTSGTAINVTVNETYPAGVAFDSSSPAPSSGDNIFSLENLTGPTVAQINITVNVSSGASGTLINSINVTYQNSTGDNLSAIVTETTTVASTPSGSSGSGGGSGGSGGIICPPLCQYPENKNLPICRNNCPQQAEVAPPVSQFPSFGEAGVGNSGIDTPSGLPPEPEQIVEESVEVVDEPIVERSGFAKFFPWLVLLVLLALLIAILSRNKDGSQPIVKVVPVKTAKPNVEANSKETQKILDDIRKSEERLRKLLGK